MERCSNLHSAVEMNQSAPGWKTRSSQCRWHTHKTRFLPYTSFRSFPLQRSLMTSAADGLCRVKNRCALVKEWNAISPLHRYSSRCRATKPVWRPNRSGLEHMLTITVLVEAIRVDSIRFDLIGSDARSRFRRLNRSQLVYRDLCAAGYKQTSAWCNCCVLCAFPLHFQWS